MSPLVEDAARRKTAGGPASDVANLLRRQSSAHGAGDHLRRSQDDHSLGCLALDSDAVETATETWGVKNGV